ncbi:MAG: hypothetical protein ABJK37_10705 [Paraglaciecola sp.]|uniref:hypothetical protein n=1 Tax=Paraglaciecola sp. TaxID=1920173 RepID=UPI0032983917
MKKTKILLLSAGSLLGKGVIDSLASRRNHIEFFGLNTNADAPQLYQCDQVQLVANLADEHFESNFLDIVEQYQPDIILPGRDDDIVFLATFSEKHSQHCHRIPAGSSNIAKIIRDKFLTYEWATEKQLPFVESFFYQGKESQSGLKNFVSKCGYPVIAKPREGFGSNGIYVAMSDEHIAALTSIEQLMFQKLLMPSKELPELIKKCKIAIPLYYQIADEQQYAAQTLIKPNGEIIEPFVSVSKMVLGRCESLRRLENTAISTMAKLYALALAKEGWRGPVNIQCKQDEQGNWLAHELNLRFSGGTSSRLLLGFDEIGNLVESFYPNVNLENLSRNVSDELVVRYLGDHLMPATSQKTLQTKKYWKNT